MTITSPIYLNIRHTDSEVKKRFEWFLQQPGCTWTSERSGEEGQSELKISRQGVLLTNGQEQLSFHPSMALIRMVNLLNGETDRYLDATQLKQGDSLIDATLGLGSDALIGAWAVGDEGNVLAFEQSPILAAFVQDGLLHFDKLIPNCKNKSKQDTWNALNQASRRICVNQGEHGFLLSRIPSRSVDVVYFDPMFRQTCSQSDSIQPLHIWSDHSPITNDVIKEACRVSRQRVVLKERKNSSEFQRLGFKILNGGRYSPVDYGVIEL